MIPHEGWLTALLDVIRSDDSIAVVGSKLLYPNGSIQHAGVVFAFYPGRAIPIHIYAGDRDGPHTNKQRDFQVVTAASMLVRRDVFVGLGGFDEAFFNGCEDVDFCLRIRERGYRVVFTPRSVLTHYVSKTRGRFSNDSENCRLLNERWGARVAPDYLRYLEADKLTVPWKYYALKASYYYSADAESSGDTILLDLLGPSLVEREILSRRRIDLTAKMLSEALGRTVGAPRSQSHSRSSLRAEILLSIGEVYYAMENRSMARHYLLAAVLTCPTFLLKWPGLSLGLKAAAPLPLILAGRKVRSKLRAPT
jgi:hypothetical protein